MSDYSRFYRAFEDKERGSRELILRRLRVYRPLLELVAQFDGEANALDVGCGRGEWLQLLSESGVSGHGVDIDGGMLEDCLELGLSVDQGDGIAWLRQQPDNSLNLISAFHVVEHIKFNQLQALVDEAHRVLKPGGFLIMETPNPENLSVGGHTFYLDPTHERPIPPALLNFLPQHFGFDRSEIWRLQEADGLVESASPGLKEVLMGVSPDYAVVAQKHAKRSALKPFDKLFERPIGIDLVTLSNRYDQSMAQQFESMARQFESADARLASECEALEARLTESRVMALSDLESRFETHQAQLEARLKQAQHELLVAYQSRSWKLTAPLRWAMLQARLLSQYGPRARTKALLRKVAAPTIRMVDRSTRKSTTVRHTLLSIARKLGIHHRLVRFYQFSRLQQAVSRQSAHGYELSEAQRRTQAGWLPPQRKLEVDELMDRIRKEVETQDKRRSEDD